MRVFLPPGNKLGIRLSSDLAVEEINDNSVTVGKVNRGDRIRSINETNLQQLSTEKLSEYLAELQGEVTLVVRRGSQTPVAPVIKVEESEEQPPPPATRRSKMRRTGAVMPEPSGKEETLSQPSSHISVPKPRVQQPPASQLRAQFETTGHRLSFTPESPSHKPTHAPLQPSRTIDFGELPQWRAPRPVVTLHNYSNGEQTVDKLHTQGMQVSISENVMLIAQSIIIRYSY